MFALAEGDVVGIVDVADTAAVVDVSVIGVEDAGVVGVKAEKSTSKSWSYLR